MQTNKLLNIISIVALVAFAAIGYIVQKALLTPAGAERAVIQTDCDLHSSDCSSVFTEGGTATLSIEPREIPLLQPLKVALSLRDINASSVQLNIIGLNMDMGINSNVLLPSPSNKQRFTGEIILPVCSMQRMEWEAQAIITTPNHAALVAPFQFYTTR